MNINFNLLKVLNAVLEEVHVTAAGQKLHLTQAATSNALKQLRAIFQDPLLIRGQGSRMSLTPLAESLKPQVKQALVQVHQVFNVDTHFDPKTSTRVFNIGMSDYLEFVLLPGLIQHISRLAPSIKLNAVHMNDFTDSALLSPGRIDVIVGNFPHAPQNLMTQHLFHDKGIFVARKNHPIFKDQHIKFKNLLEYEFIMVSFTQDPQNNYLDYLFKRAKLAKRVSVTVPHAMIALQALVDSDLITHTCWHLAEPFAKQAGLKLISQPTGMPSAFNQDEYQAKQYWHKTQTQDRAHQWLRQQIKLVAEQF